MIIPDDMLDIVDDSKVLFEKLIVECTKFNKNVAMTALINTSVSLFQHLGMPKEEFMRVFSDTWDHFNEVDKK